jgi:hypothetical protein
MSQNSKELKKLMKEFSEKYCISIAEIERIIKEAKDEVEVPDCTDCEHKRFHDNRGGYFH